MKLLLSILAGLGVMFGIVPQCDGAVESKYNLDDLLNAIATVESNNNPTAVGDNGKAVGLFQIHKIYVDDVNRILGYPAFAYADRLDPQKSRSMISVYLRHYGKNKSLDDMARIHNGGPRGYKKKSTLRYCQKVRRVMVNQ